MRLRLFSFFILLFPLSALGQVKSYINWQGEYRLRGRYLDQYVQQGAATKDRYSNRLILKGDFAPNDQIFAHLAVNLNSNLGSGHQLFAGLQPDSQDALFNAQLLSAYADWNLWGNFFLKFGRLPIEHANQAFFSQNTDDLRPYSFDSLVFAYASEDFDLNAAVLRVAEWTNVGQTERLSKSSFLFSFQLKELISFMRQAYFFYYRSFFDSFDNGTLQLQGGNLNNLGLSLSGDLFKTEYTIDYVNQSGDLDNNSGVSAWMLDFNLAFRILTESQTKIFTSFHYDTGTKVGSASSQSYRPHYYNHHAKAGLMDLLAWGNLTYYKLGFKTRFSEKDSLLFQTLLFRRTAAALGPNAIYPNAFDSTAGALVDSDAHFNASSSSSRLLGYEMDVEYRRNYASNAYWEILAGYFMLGDYFKDYGRNKDPYAIRITTGFTF